MWRTHIQAVEARFRGAQLWCQHERRVVHLLPVLRVDGRAIGWEEALHNDTCVSYSEELASASILHVVVESSYIHGLRDVATHLGGALWRDWTAKDNLR